jgi:hypothetical protein
MYMQRAREYNFIQNHYEDLSVPLSLRFKVSSTFDILSNVIGQNWWESQMGRDHWEDQYVDG